LSKHDEKTVPYSIRIRQSQKEYITTKENASEWIREAIDKAILEETCLQAGDTSASKEVILKRIDVLKKELQKIIQDPFYQEAIENMKYMIFSLGKIKKSKEISITKRGIAKGMIKADGAALPFFLSPAIEFVVQNDLEFDKPIPEDMKQPFIKHLEQHFDYTEKRFHAIRERSKQLQAEIEKLQEKLSIK